MMNTLNTAALDLQALIRLAEPVAMQTEVRSLHRVQAECAQAALDPVHWSVQATQKMGADGQDHTWLYVSASCTLPLICVRCMHGVSQNVQFDNIFRFVADENTALAEDDDCDEDLLVDSGQFNLLELLEDELLMAMPMLPKHGECASEHTQTYLEADGDSGVDAAPHPFAALSQWRKNTQPK